MPFSRRNPVGFTYYAREFFWPRMGWRRYFRYLRYRVVRLPGTPHTIAIGFAFGAAVSFTPLIGVHFVLGAVLAWIIGGNLLAAIIGTGVGNPWTFPIIWYWIHTLGSWILRADPGTGVPTDFGITYLLDNFVDVFVPMVVGGVPTSIVVWPIFYYLARYVVGAYQRGRKTRIERAASRRSHAAAASKAPVSPGKEEPSQ